MKKCVILLAATAVLCCGCGTTIEQTAASVSEQELTAPALEDVSGLEAPEAAEETAPPLAPAQDEETAAAPADASQEEEMTAPPLEASQEAPEAPAAEENRDADYAWFGRGVYEARIDGQATGEYYLFTDTRSGKYMTGNNSYDFTCAQTRYDVVFNLDGLEIANVYAILGSEDNGDIIGEMGEARYIFTLLPIAPEDFTVEGWEQTHQEE